MPSAPELRPLASHPAMNIGDRGTGHSIEPPPAHCWEGDCFDGTLEAEADMCACRCAGCSQARDALLQAEAEAER